MKCPKCGNDVAQNAKFCGVCGTAISADLAQNPTTNADTASKKPMPIKKLVLLGGIVLAAVIVVILLVSIPKPSNYVFSDGSSFFVRQEDNEVVITHTNGNTSAYEGFLTNVYGTSGSLDFGKGVVAISNNAYTFDERLTTFYYISEDGVKAFADARGDGDIRCKVSADGNAVVFATGMQYGSSDRLEGELRIFDGKKTQTLPSEFCPYYDFRISPDGKTVVYNADYNEGEYVTYIWNNGKISELGYDLDPVAVSNGGKLVYFRDTVPDNEKWYVQKGDNRIKLGLDEDIGYVYSNKDNTEILFGAGDKTYLCINGDELFSLDGFINDLVLPSDVNKTWFGSFVTMNIDSFENAFYSTDSGIYRITESHDSELVTGATDSAILANDGKTLFYLSYGTIYSENGFDTSAKTKKIAEDSVYSFDITSDGSAVCYLTYEGELYYKKGDSEPKLIDHGLELSGKQFTIHDKSNTVFYISDGELFSSNAGEKASIVSAIDDNNLTMVSGKGNLVCAYNEDYELTYWSTDGKTFNLIGAQ